MNTIHFNHSTQKSINCFLEVAGMFSDGLLGNVFQLLEIKMTSSKKPLTIITISALLHFVFISSISQLVFELAGMDISLVLEMCFYCLKYETIYKFVGGIFSVQFCLFTVLMVGIFKIIKQKLTSFTNTNKFIDWFENAQQVFDIAHFDKN